MLENAKKYTHKKRKIAEVGVNFFKNKKLNI